ncbi:MAG: hypothetical protein H7844_10960 [Nitrospirae bacterium YQR-1]
MGVVSIKESGRSTGEQEARLSKDFFDKWNMHECNRIERHSAVGSCDFTEILIADKDTASRLCFIEKYINTGFEIFKSEGLLMFLDLCKGILVNEIVESGLQLKEINFSVYDPKSIKILKEIIALIVGSTEVTAQVLDELNRKLDESNMRNLLIEYVHAVSEYYISSGRAKITMSQLADKSAIAAFSTYVMQYGNTQTAHYFVENVVMM